MSYIGLGSRSAKGAADVTGNNSGNWTVTFDPSILYEKIPYIECYKMIITGAPGSSVKIFIDQRQWDSTPFASNNSWDPTQPMLLIPGQTLYFYWSDPTTDNTPPTVTIWLRYDPSLDANQRAVSA